MNIIHLAVGDIAANAIAAAVQQDEQTNGEVMVLKDVLSVGPLKDEAIGTFSEVRSDFWNRVSGEGQPVVAVDDLERLMQLSSRISNGEDLKIWFWMGAIPADVTAYFWLLHFLKKHSGRFLVINIAGLPFLDENGKLFYPDSFGNLPQKEILKARKLARVVTPSEWETDGEEWKKLVAENAGIRLLEGGKKLSARGIDLYDDLLFNLLTNQNQKASRVVNQAMAKNKIFTGDMFLHWRLRTFATHGKAEMQKGDIRLNSGGEEEIPTSDAITE